MKPFTLVCVVTLFTAGLACAQQGAPASGGQDTAALEQKVRDLEDRLIALEGQPRVRLPLDALREHSNLRCRLNAHKDFHRQPS